MGNTATTFNEQIALLEKRGMVIDMEPNKVKEILLDIGYYNTSLKSSSRNLSKIKE